MSETNQINKEYPTTIHRGVDKVQLKNKKSDINQLFLYNKHIDALIYSYFLDQSYPVKNDNGQTQTRVWKSQIPSQEEIAKICRMSKSTYCRKLKVLKDEIMTIYEDMMALDTITNKELSDDIEEL